MGQMKHHAIVVTSRDQYPEIAHAKAVKICGANFVTPLGAQVINARRSFLVTPDGSYEGWDESHAGDDRRKRFVRWLNRQRFSDGSTPYDWVLIEYGERDGDDGWVDGAEILEHAWEVETSDDYDGPHDLDKDDARSRRPK